MSAPYLLLTIFACWLVFSVVGTFTLYIGYGFVMSAKRANDLRLSQKWVANVDIAIAIPFVLLDALLNLVTYSVVNLDFRPSQMFKRQDIKGRTWYLPQLVTGRLNSYCRNPDERAFRRTTADFFAAFLDGKDPSGDHISGPNFRFPWLD